MGATCPSLRLGRRRPSIGSARRRHPADARGAWVVHPRRPVTSISARGADPSTRNRMSIVRTPPRVVKFTRQTCRPDARRGRPERGRDALRVIAMGKGWDGPSGQPECRMVAHVVAVINLPLPAGIDVSLPGGSGAPASRSPRFGTVARQRASLDQASGTLVAMVPTSGPTPRSASTPMPRWRRSASRIRWRSTRAEGR
jgi:hypothetical protein